MRRRNTSSGRRPVFQWSGALLLLGNALVLAAALTGGLFAFLTAYELGGEVGPLLAACCILTVLSLALWSLPRGSYPGALCVLTIGGLGAWRWREALQPALQLVLLRLGDACSRLGTAGSGESIRWTAETAEAAASLPQALLLLAALLSLALGWAVVRARRWWLVLALTLLPVFPAVLAGTLPDWRALMAVMASVLSLLLTGLYSRSDQSALGRSLLLSMAASVLLLVGLNAAMPQEGYTRPQWAADAKLRLQTLAIQGFEAVLDWELPGLSGEDDPYISYFPGTQETDQDAGLAIYSDAGGAVDLAAAGPRQYSGATVFQVEGEETGRVYLRGSSVSSYTGQSWEPVSEAEYAALAQRLSEALGLSAADVAGLPLLFPALTDPDGASLTMTIRPVNMTAGVAYAPYQLVEILDGSVTAAGDALLRQSSLSGYQVSYRPVSLESGVFTPLTEEGAAAAEAQYRLFVYENYLDMPQETEARLAPLLEEMNQQAISWPEAFPEAYQEALAQSRRAAGLLSSLAVYDLSTPAMEADEDFVEHFLSQGRGYCMHFATAGTLLLRLSGIPARYVSGYVAYLDQSGRANVRDYSAHAWVEIYLDGYGWYPVEMTPAYLGEDGEIPQEEPLPEPEDPVDTAEQPEAPEAGQTPGDAETKTLDLRWLRWAVLVLALLGALAAPRLLAKRLRRRAMDHPDTGRSVVAAYRWYRRLLSWGGVEETELEELGRKAAFSQHAITEEERRQAWSCAQHAASAAEGRLPWWKRLAFRWLWLLG